MRGYFITLSLAAVLSALGLMVTSSPAQYPGGDPRFTPRRQPPLDDLYPVYRLFDRSTSNHVYTIDGHEVDVLARRRTHNFEGVGFQTFARPQPGMRPLYRFVRPDGKHFLDTDRRAGARQFARLESTLGHVAVDQRFGLVPLNAWYHPHEDLFFYTTHPRGELAPRTGYVYQGVLGYVVPDGRGP